MVSEPDVRLPAAFGKQCCPALLLKRVRLMVFAAACTAPSAVADVPASSLYAAVARKFVDETVRREVAIVITTITKMMAKTSIAPSSEDSRRLRESIDYPR